MPRRLDTDTTLDDHEDEIDYTRAALAADPDAEDLLPMTDMWTSMVEIVRALGRKRRQALAGANARRMVANARLDFSCQRFGESLLLACGRDRSSGRYRQFYGNHTPTSFSKQALAKQVAAVGSWTTLEDEAFTPHKPNILTWSSKAERALGDTAGLAGVHGEFAIGEERLAEDMTRERDSLHAVLTTRAGERHLPRNWPDTFFRVEPRRAPAPAQAPGPDEG